MIKYVLILAVLSFTMHVQASTSKDKYIQGLKAYKSKNYTKSFDLFSSLYLSNLSDKKLNFYLGRSAFEIGYYEMALASFERVSMLDPSDILNRLEMARTYFMLKMYENSERLFRSVLANSNLPPNVRKNIEIYISKMTVTQAKSVSYITFNFNWMYDSNVNYASSQDIYYNDLLKTDLETTPKIFDFGTEVSAGFGNIYTNGRYSIKTNVMAYTKEYDSEEAYNVSYSANMLSFLYKDEKYTSELALSFDTLKLAQKKYLHTYSIGPKFEFNHTPTLKSIAYFKYQSKYFQQDTQKYLNADRYVLSYGLQKFLSPRSLMQISLVGATEKDARLDGKKASIYTNYNEYKLNMTYVNQFTSRYDMQFITEGYKRKYKDESTIFIYPIREDNSVSTIATVNANLAYKIRVNLKATYTKVYSNQNVFEYNKHTLAIGFNKVF